MEFFGFSSKFLELFEFARVVLNCLELSGTFGAFWSFLDSSGIFWNFSGASTCSNSFFWSIFLEFQRVSLNVDIFGNLLEFNRVSWNFLEFPGFY